MLVDNLNIYDSWESSEKFYNNIMTRQETSNFRKIRGLHQSRLKNGIIIHDGQPGTGKTYTLAKAIKDHPNIRIAFFSANHDHLEEFKKDLYEFGILEGEFIHGKGFNKSCELYPKNKPREKWTKDEILIHKIYNGFGVKSSQLLCSSCIHKDDCEYHDYTHNAKKYRITLQPLEFLYTKYNEDKDIFVVDEAVSKKESVYWNFNLEKFKRFIHVIERISKESKNPTETYGLRKYVDTFLEFHQTILKNTSLIFTEAPETLFNFNDKTFKHKKDIVQNRRYVVHSGIISPLSCFETKEFGELIRLISYESRTAEGIIKYTNEQIREVIKKGDIVKIDELIDNYIPLWQCIQFFKVLLAKPDIKTKSSCFLVSEKLELADYQNLNPKPETPKAEGRYEWGFTAECLYIRNIKTNECIVSRMGKAYGGEVRILDLAKDVWFTIGHPFLFQILNESEGKPVILLDATFNEDTFNKLYTQWRTYRLGEKALEHNDDRGLTTNVYMIKRYEVENKNSIVYDVKGHFPLATMEKNLPKIVGSIATILDEKPDKTHAIISSLRFEEKIQKLFPKAVTAHHFNERGKNIDTELLFTIGTPFNPPFSIIFDYILTFNEYPKSTETIRHGKKFVGYKDPILNEILRLNVYDENYHETHRNRPLLYNRINYNFYELPPRMREEVTVIPVELDKISGYPLFKIMEKIIRDEGMSRTLFHSETKQRTLYDRVGGGKALLEKLEEAERITIATEGTKTKKKLVIYSTDKGREWYKKYKGFYLADFLKKE